MGNVCMIVGKAGASVNVHKGREGDSEFSFQATENAVSLPEFAKTCARSHTPQSCQSRAHRVQLTEQQQELAPEVVCIQQLLARETRLSLSEI